MKALQIIEPGKTQLVQKDIPKPLRGEVLLRIHSIGFCGSDLSTFQGRNPMVTYPRIPGHEIGATIEELGEDVSNSFKQGMPVTVVPYSNCGKCASCKRGRAYACRYNQTLGVQRDGAMMDYVTVPAEKLISVPGLGVRELSVVEPLTVGFHAIARARVEASDVVAVFGCGMIGIGAITGAVERGATVIAIDLDDSKLETAKILGATFTINSRTENLHERLVALTDDRGPDVCIEAAGHPVSYRQTVEEVAFTGRIACIGYAKDEVSFATKLFVQKEIDIMGSRNAEAADFQRVASYLARGGFPYDRVISREIPLEEAGSALNEWAANPGNITKILVKLSS